MPITDPYEKCPVYETENFRIRLLEESDANDLLSCYANPAAAELFNSDNCLHNFVCHSLDDINGYIQFWLEEYRLRRYVRFSIIDKQIQKAAGTIEMFTRKKNNAQDKAVGVLRIDLGSRYEKKYVIMELLEVANTFFFHLFNADCIITKAIPKAAERISALTGCGYSQLADPSITSFDHYYMIHR